MAVYTDTYDNLLLQAEAEYGTPFSATDKAQFNGLMNLAAQRARKKSDYWERTLVVGQPRRVRRGYLQESEDSFHVYGAGTDEVNGLYERNGTANSKARYSKYTTDETGVLWDIEWDGATDWQILVGADHGTLIADTVYYDITDSSTAPPTSGWAASSGTTPAPLLNDVADIETPLYWQERDPADRASHTYEFQAGTYGVRPWAKADQNSIVYVTYIKRLTDRYGDGTSGTTSSIPSEWFNYMSSFAVYRMQVANRQGNPNAGYTLALRDVESTIEDEMMRLETQGIPQTVRQNVETRISYSSIL